MASIIPGGLAGGERNFVQAAPNERFVVERFAGCLVRNDGDQTGGLAGQVMAAGGRDQVGVLVEADAGDDGVSASTALSPQVRIVGVKARRSCWLGRAPGCSQARLGGPQAGGPLGVGGGPGARVVEHGRGGDGNDSAGEDVGAAVLRHRVLVVTGEVPAGALMVGDLAWFSVASLPLVVYLYEV